MSRRSTWLVAGEAAVLVGACVIAALDSTAADWQPPELFAGAAGARARERLARASSTRRSGSPARSWRSCSRWRCSARRRRWRSASLSVLVDQLRARNPLPRLIANLATYATFPLVGGLLIEVASARSTCRTTTSAFSALVFGVFLVTNLLNFLGIAGDYVFHDARVAEATSSARSSCRSCRRSSSARCCACSSRSSTSAAASARSRCSSSCCSSSSTCCASCCCSQRARRAARRAAARRPRSR